MTFSMPMAFYIQLVGVPLMFMVAALLTEYYEEKHRAEQEEWDEDWEGLGEEDE
ncbi:MAG: hypothetical protein MPK31_01320 [Gammaproteobacteria bacterium]|nr:hypothetical protein [Gammaproteobacteria bacterium]MDA7989600.1 hypothetical protein [Gammaproteobacteria bacterium]MDA8014311.1 hypothetical protein [Gammaproteobacteria bacterium]MDA8021549.1 hypothetical protein [Gammaproteobacteria bacterium]